MFQILDPKFSKTSMKEKRYLIGMKVKREIVDTRMNFYFGIQLSYRNKTKKKDFNSNWLKNFRVLKSPSHALKQRLSKLLPATYNLHFVPGIVTSLI